MLVGFEEGADTVDEAGFELRAHHFAIEGFFGGSEGKDLRLREVVTVEVADDGVRALAVHAVEHGVGGDDAVAGVEFSPDDAVEGVGIDDDAVHVEDECLNRGHVFSMAGGGVGWRGFRALGDNWEMQAAIVRDPEVMHGTPVFRGTRVPVQTMFDYLENGDGLGDFLEGFPTISRELAVQVLEECKELRLARV